MITSVVQRWRGGRASYLPVGEWVRFDPRRYEVAALDGPGSDKTAKAFVLEHHYSASYPSAKVRVGLYRGGALVGLTVFSTPASGAVLDALPCPRSAAVELGRLVMLEDVEANGETWFIARAFEELRRRGYAGVVSFADPVPRAAVGGKVVFRPHRDHLPGQFGALHRPVARTDQAAHAGRTGLGRADHLEDPQPRARLAVLGGPAGRRRRPRADLHQRACPADLAVARARPHHQAAAPRRESSLLFALAPFVRRRLAKLYPELPYPKMDPEAHHAPDL